MPGAEFNLLAGYSDVASGAAVTGAVLACLGIALVTTLLVRRSANQLWLPAIGMALLGALAALVGLAVDEPRPICAVLAFAVLAAGAGAAVSRRRQRRFWWK